MFDFVLEIKKKIINIVVLFKNHVGEENFKKIFYALFCLFLFYASYWLSRQILSGKIYFEIILVCALAATVFFIQRRDLIFYLVIVCLPFTEFPLSFKFDALNFANLIYALFLFVYLFSCVVKNKITITKTPLDLAFKITVLVFFVSIIQTRYIGEVKYIIGRSFINAPYFRTLFQLVLFVFMISAFYVTVAMLKDKEKLKAVLRLWIYTGTVIAVLGLYGYFFANWGLPFASKFMVLTLGKVKSTFKEPVFYGLYLGTILPLLYSLILNKSGEFTRKFLWTSFIINFLALFLSGSRAAWLATIISFITISAMNMKFKSKRHAVLVIAGITLAALVFVLIVILVASAISSAAVERSFFNIFSGKDFSALARLDAMATAWVIFTEHPILGAGLGNYYFLYLSKSPLYDLIYVWAKDQFAAHVNPDANNMYLTFLAETGILGLGGVLFIFFTAFTSMIKTIKNSKDKYWTPFLKGYIGALCYMLVNYFFTSTLMFLFMWVMFGIIFSIIRQCAAQEA